MITSDIAQLRSLSFDITKGKKELYPHRNFLEDESLIDHELLFEDPNRVWVT